MHFKHVFYKITQLNEAFLHYFNFNILFTFKFKYFIVSLLFINGKIVSFMFERKICKVWKNLLYFVSAKINYAKSPLDIKSAKINSAKLGIFWPFIHKNKFRANLFRIN